MMKSGVCANCGNCCGVHKSAYWLLVIGGLNWGLIGLVKLNVLNSLLGSWPWVERIVYILVGLSAIAMITQKMCKMCGMKPEDMK